jgi:ribosome assembly protein YihI (activator of Der GTPase)
VLASVVLAGCNTASKKLDKHIVSQEVYTMTLGDKEVYAVKLNITTNQKLETLGAEVKLSAQEQSWVDTLYLELRKNDTIETEAIFSKLTKEKHPTVNAEVKFFPL